MSSEASKIMNAVMATPSAQAELQRLREQVWDNPATRLMAAFRARGIMVQQEDTGDTDNG